MRYAMLGALASATFVTAGCGGVSLDAVARAADTSSKQASEHMDMTATVLAQGKTISMTGSGDFQNKPVLGDLSVTVDAAGHSESMREVMQGTTIYLSSTLFGTELPAGKTWLSIDVAKAVKTLGVSYSSLASQSPTGTFDQLKANSTVTKVGTETINGFPTTHYTATVDPKKISKLEKLGLSVQYEPIDAWVDDQGLIRRMHIHFVSQGDTTDVTTDFSNYDEALNVTVPPSSETFDPTQNGGSS